MSPTSQLSVPKGSSVSAMRYRPIVGTLAYLVAKDRDGKYPVGSTTANATDSAAGEESVLMVTRNARPDDDQFNKVNGVGGKVEIDEDIVTSVIREIREETGVEVTELTLRATVTFSDFGPKREQWLVFIFLVTDWQGTPWDHNDEGSLAWVPKSRLLQACSKDEAVASQAGLEIWEGDKNFIPLVFDDDERVVHAVMPYDGDRPKSWRYTRI